MNDGEPLYLALRPRDGSSRDERRQRIIATATRLFLEQGFARTSMSQVAAAVGGSKTTLWSYFGGKTDLFLAVADHLIERYFAPVERYLATADSLPDDLLFVARALIDASTSSEVSGLMRVATAESLHVDALAAMFHDRGLGHGWRVIAAYLDRAKAAGTLAPDCDTLVAARQFVGLCQAHRFQLVMLTGAPAPTEAQRDEDAKAAVDTFLRAFAAR